MSTTAFHLVEQLPKRAPETVLVARDPGGVVALAACATWPDAKIVTHYLDAFEARGATRTFHRNDVTGIEVALTPDLPGGPFDLVAIGLPARGEALLGRELLEQAHDALRPDGRLLASTDGGTTWLRKVVKEVFGRADLQGRAKIGGLVTTRRTRSDARRRDHDHVVEVTRGERTLALKTRPGVFSPGRLDIGTRALLESFTAPPGARVLDLGCGIGALGLCAAVDAGPDGVVMVDSSARAVAVAEENALVNGLDAARCVLRADLEDLPGGPFDVVLANPPYFSHGRIADVFCATSARELAGDGVLRLVAKAVPLHGEILERHFRDVRVTKVRDYGIFEARSPDRRH